MKKIIFLVTILTFFSYSGFSQSENTIKFVNRYSEKDNDVMKFAVSGEIKNVEAFEKMLGEVKGVIEVKVRNTTTGSCLIKSDKSLTADAIRTVLLKNGFDIERSSIKILSKAYFLNK